MDIEETGIAVNRSRATAVDDIPVRSVVVIGTGLIGTSVALSLRRQGVDTYLHDTDPAAVAAAAARGAGVPGLPPAAVDLTVIAVPPDKVAAVLAEYQTRGLSRLYTDVASVKSAPLAEAERLRCDLATYVGGHPMAGGERSGPVAASAELFDGRVWVLTPVAGTRADVLRSIQDLVVLAGGRPVLMAPADHDRAVARTSHVPHLVSALLAARLAGADTSVLRLCGAGIRDATRIAAGDADLWTAIMRANAVEVSKVLSEVAADVLSAGAALSGSPAALSALLRRGNAGRAALFDPIPPSSAVLPPDGAAVVR
ncbi:prephenate dehydrogenase [Nocardia thraciensis]